MSDRQAFAEPPAVADDRAARARRERVWRDALASEPVVAQPDASALHDAMADGTITEADVMAGIEAALAKRDFRPRHWRSLVGWARKAASDRMAASPRAAGGLAASAPSAADLWELEGGMKRSVAVLEAEVAAWDAGRAWNDHLGFPPDSEYTSLPEHLWRSARGQPRNGGAQIVTEKRPEVLQ